MEYGPILTAALAALAGIVSSVITILASRGKNKADAAQTEANADVRSSEGFKLLTDELRKERIELTGVIERQAGKIERQSEEIEALRLQVFEYKRTVDTMLENWRRGEPAPLPEPRGNRP